MVNVPSLVVLLCLFTLCVLLLRVVALRPAHERWQRLQRSG